MKITKSVVAGKVAAYLRHELTLAEVVDWSENALLVGEVAQEDAAELSPVLARLGMGDVREFGLTWEDCREMLHQLGFAVRVDVVAA